MRVVFVPHGYAPSIGGAQAYTRGLAEGLVRLGHEVHVVAPDITDPEAFYEAGHDAVGVLEEMIHGVTVYRIPYDAARTPRTRRGTRRLLTRAREGYERALASRLAELAPAAVVTLPHVFPNVEATLRLRGRDNWPVVYAPLLHENDPNWPTERITDAVGRSDALIALTSHERQRLVSAYGARDATTVVIPPGVDAPTLWSSERDGATVLVLGRRAASKRIDVAYEAMQTVWESVPDAQLVVAGSPPRSGDDPAAEIANDERVRVVDVVGDAARGAMLDSARLLVSASVVESFGITTLEAWAHGTPVVVADTPVSRSVVRDGVDGLVAPPGAAGLAEAIERLLSTPGLGQRLGTTGRERVVAEFSWERSSRALDALLDRVAR